MAEQKAKPEGALASGWFPLGPGRGIEWTLWKSNVTFQRQEKQGDKWIILEELHVAPKVLKELAWRAPLWLDKMEEKIESKDGEDIRVGFEEGGWGEGE
jgi:hypothetical protein